MAWQDQLNWSSFKKKRSIVWIGKILRWAIPIVILILIFQRIDLIEFKLKVKNAHPGLIVLATASS